MTQPSMPGGVPQHVPPTDELREGVHAELRRADRATTFAWIAFAAQVLLTLVAFALWNNEARIYPLLGAALFAAMGIIAVSAIVLLSALRRASVVEQIELEQAARAEGSSIFATDADARPAYKRLQLAYRWLLPLASILLAAGLINAALYLFSHVRERVIPNLGEDDRPSTAALSAGFCVGIAFVGFIIGRYLIGMASTPAWRLMHAAGVYLLGGVYLLLLIGAGLLAATFNLTWALNAVEPIVAAILLLIGLEILFNQVLDFYRPRDTALVPRPAFDSRLLALVASPGSVVRSLNEAVNYQFGFEITQSWFWRLLSNAAIWLVATGVIVLLLLSCVIIVQPGESVIVTRFGRIVGQPRDAGLHLKAPWPIDTYERYQTTSVRRLQLVQHGAEPEANANLDSAFVPVLWTNRHEHGGESLLIMASSAQSSEGDSSGPAVALAGMEAFIHWHIADVMTFATQTEDAEKLLQSLAQRELSRLVLEIDIDQLLGDRRDETAVQLLERVRQAATDANLGVSIDWAGIAGVYPPKDGEVANEFQQAVASRQQAVTAIERALQQTVGRLAAAAGSQEAAQEIVKAIDTLDRLQADRADQAEIDAQSARIEQLVLSAGGDAAVKLSQANGERWFRENQERARAARFEGQSYIYAIAPRVYANKLLLDAWQRVSADRRKYLLWLKDTSNVLIRVDATANTSSFERISLPPAGGPPPTN